jgi:CRISPR-associated exonuclease Cas4
MLARPVSEGALYYGQPKRRQVVTFDEDLRARTNALAQDLHACLGVDVLPAALVGDPRCRSCSLVEVCQPDIVGRSAASWLDRSLDRILRGKDEEGNET